MLTLSLRCSRVHSVAAVMSGFHLAPTLYDPYRNLLVPINANIKFELHSRIIPKQVSSQFWARSELGSVWLVALFQRKYKSMEQMYPLLRLSYDGRPETAFTQSKKDQYSRRFSLHYGNIEMFSGQILKRQWLIVVAIAAFAAIAVACGTDETVLNPGGGGVGAQPTQNPGDSDGPALDPGYKVVEVLAPIDSVQISPRAGNSRIH